MAKDAIGFALSALNRLAGSSMLDRLGMRHTAERLAYRLTKGGFQVITTSARAFKSNNPSDKPQRLDAPGHTTGLFDLGITDEQRMIRDSVRAFAAEVLCQDLAVTRGALAFVAADGGAAGAARRAAPPPRRPFGLHKPWAYNLDMRVFEAWRRELLADLEARVLAAGVARAASDARCVAGAAAASDIYEGV